MMWPQQPDSKTSKQPGVMTSAPTTGSPKPWPELWVTGLGLYSLPGDQPFGLLGAVCTNLSGARPKPGYSFPLPGKGEDAQVLIAPIDALEGIEHPFDRMLVLAEAALGQIAESTLNTLNGEKVLVVTLLPPSESARGSQVNLEELEEALRALHPALAKAHFRFASANEGAGQQLRIAGAELAEKKWDAVIFGGCDSLVDAVTCRALSREHRIMTVGGAEGLVPGEGAAYLVLQTSELAKGHQTQQIWAKITGLGTAPEPHSLNADSKPMTGLTIAMRQALSPTGLAATAIDEVILPFGAETAGELEWFQVTQALWPSKTPSTPARTNEAGPEDDIPGPSPSLPEELRFCYALGELGAATIPFAMALACARFEFEHPTATNLLVCEAGDPPQRGAMLMHSPSSNLESNRSNR